ncbi:hypothetical protein HII17_15175 [Thalassotalea sp. M1531]|uniref:UDP-2,4-diacetamido-2,4, 6-trideoxy-beta-L-altropyranose hydrolase n=1 Tax=Thalassotalea algicola TaxID=2716224 RepID=A0A7Y0Q7Z6_9GAMM|nr:hypothetical protein [Thalassotalea algicola]NMP32898.1 hypothetical protein [Thalassotalea algicola]
MAAFVFHCHANTQTGLGHLSRCLQIALAIKTEAPESQITFVGDYHDFAKQLLSSYHYDHLPKFVNKMLANANLVLDNYHLNQAEINEFRQQAKGVIKIDDFDEFDLSALDLVVNFRLGFDNHPYKAQASALGVSYYPFKQALINIRESNLAKKGYQLNNILVFIGGSDNSSAGEKLIKLIDTAVHGKNIYWLTNDNQHSDNYLCQHNELTTLPLTPDIEAYYQQADFFINGGGLAKYEASFCAIPNACISQNLGQKQDSEIFANYGLSYDLGLTEQLEKTPKLIAKKLANILNLAEHNQLIEQSRQTFTSQSPKRLAQAILKAAK